MQAFRVQHIRSQLKNCLWLLHKNVGLQEVTNTVIERLFILWIVQLARDIGCKDKGLQLGMSTVVEYTLL